MHKIHEIVSYIFYTLKSFFSDVIFKVIGAYLYIIYSFAFDIHMEKAMAAIIALIIFDFITGILAAKVSGEEIKSSKIIRSAVKMLVYLLMVSGAHMVELASGIITIADDIIIAFLAVTELISLLENAGRMGYAVPNKLLNKLQEYRDSK